MKRKALLLLGVGLALLMGVAGMAFAANPYLHYFDCKNCHFANATMASMSADHVCLKCHAGASVTAPNDKLVAPLASALDPTGAADGKPGMINWKSSTVFSVGDASNKFGHNPAPGKQTSHNWAASNLQSDAGAGEPLRTNYTGFYSRYGASVGKVTCSRCHNPHGEAVIDANADYNPVTRTGIDNPLGNPKLLIADSQNLNKPIDPEKMCRACHATYAAQTAGNHGLVGHAVNSIAGADTYASFISGQGTKYNATPLVPAAPYDKSYPVLINGKMTCLSCHNMHYVDSNSTTADGLAGAASLATGDGNLLRGDGEQFMKDPARGVSFCNTCHTYTSAFHGSGANAIGCLGCHGGHNNTNPAQPSYYMLNGNYTSLPADAAQRAQIWGGTQAGVLDGFCESCHGNIEDNFPTLTTSLYGHTAGMTQCDNCHQSHGAGSFSQPVGCDGCHGSPPQVNAPGNSAAPGWATGGYAWATAGNNYAATSYFKNEATTPHFTHSGATSAYRYDCKVCHNTHYNNFATTHNQGLTSYRDVLETGASNPYDVKASGNGAMTPAYADVAGTCSNVYCHSNGGVNNGTGTRTGYNPATPGWAGTRGTITCASCHGNDTTTMGAAGKVNSAAHIKHLAAGFSCNFCHVNTATGATALKAGAAGTTHINVAVDVAFDTTSVLKAGGAAMSNGTTPWGGATSTVCSAVYCHSNGNINAGETVYRSIDWTSTAALTCTSCHNIPGTAGDKQTAAHAAHVNGSTSNVGRNLDCAVCHDYTMDLGNNTTIPAGGQIYHVNGVVEKKMNFAGIDLGTCSNISCHSDGNFEVGATTTYKNAVWTGATTYGCASCHGNGTVSYPTYANGGLGVNSNSHVKHIASGATCNECHSQTSTAGIALDGTDKTKHVNRTVEVSGAKITSYTDGTESCAAAACHGAGSPRWGGTIASCRECHSNATTDTDSWTYNGTAAAIALNEWTYSGHGRWATATYEVTGRPGADLDAKAGAGQDGCLYCHDGAINHNDTNYFRLRSNGYTWGTAGADLNGACLSCHKTGTTTFDPDGAGGLNAINVTSVVKVDNYHGGAKHTTNNGGRWCWDCHDPHGDASATGQRIQMVQRNPLTNSNANGVPSVWSTTTVVFTWNTVGAGTGGYAMNAAPFAQGICNACHTSVAQYTKTTGAGTHATGKCVDCHKHSDTAKQLYNEAFKGAGCSGCHGNSATDRYWPDGTAHPDDAGRHQKHMEVLAAKLGYTLATADDTQQKTMCAYCHPGPGVTNHNDATVNVTLRTLWGTADSGAVWSTASNGTCATTDCHNGKTANNTYAWYVATATSTCTMCHTTGGAGANPVSGVHWATNSSQLHDDSLPGGCGACHVAPAYSPTSTHIDGNFVADSASNTATERFLSFSSTTTWTEGTPSTCTSICHADKNSWARQWSTNANVTSGAVGSARCNVCHGQASNWRTGLTVNHNLAGVNATANHAECDYCHYDSADYLNDTRHRNWTGGPPTRATVTYNSNAGYATGTGSCTNACHATAKNMGRSNVTTIFFDEAVAGPTITCNSCHNDVGGAATVKTMAGYTFQANTAGNLAHTKHVATAATNYAAAAANNSSTTAYDFTCANCHGNTGANHMNGTLNISLSGPGWASATKQCSNNACHEDGMGGNAAVTADWDLTGGWVSDPTTDKCDNCHGNGPTTMAHGVHAVGIHYDDVYSGTTSKLSWGTAQASAHGNSTTSTTLNCNICHSQTVTMARNMYGSACVSCHSGDTANSTNIMSVGDKSKHVDGATEVAFASLSGYKSKSQLRNDITAVGSLNTYWTRNNDYKTAASYDAAKWTTSSGYAAGTCSAIACHNGYDAKWEPPVGNCTACHTVTPQ